MWRVTWKGLLAHKLRLALTALAVVLGVAFVAGSFILTDTIERSFADVITQTAGGVDANVRPAGADPAFGAGFTQERASVPAALLEAVRVVEGVTAADPVVGGIAQIVRPDGEPVGGTGAPTLGFNAPSHPGFGGIEVREGRLPEREGEVAVDAFTARTQGFEVGEEIGVAAGAAAETVTLVGVVGFGEADNLAGATVALFDLETAVARYSPDGDFDSIDVLAAEGVSGDVLAERISAAISDDFEVATAQQLIDENTESIGQVLGIFSTALLVFAGVALFVGVFIIVNTFSIIVAQRVREFALLRAVGASRRQVLVSVLTEAGVIGLLGGTVGLALGALLAIALRAMLAAFGLDLPAEGLVFQVRTVVVAVVVGLVVTVTAAVAPALRATRIAPVQALQAVAAPPTGRQGWIRSAVGSVLLLGGVALLLLGLFGAADLIALGGGAVAVFLGVAFLAPLVARPIVRVLGWPVARWFGVRGELARENAMRNPRRTATTASALMIGVGLVSFVTIFAASMTASITDAVDEVYLLDFDVRSTTFQPISGDIADELGGLDEVRLAVTQRMGTFTRDGGADRFVIGADADRIDQIYALDMVDGSLDALLDGGVIVSEGQDLAVGDTLTATFPATGEGALEVVGVFDGASVDVDYFVDTATYRERYRGEEVFAVGVRLADSVDLEAGQTAIDEVLAPYPGVQALDRSAVREQLTDQINQLLGLVYGLLALAVVIAFFGIVNTLALSVFERIREIGLLRAVGMTRGQVKAMVRWESMLIAVLGVVLGLVVGAFFGWLLVQALADDFALRFVFPAGQLLVAVVLAALAGVVAGVLPARRASRVDVLAAIAAE
ncbi:MAG: FtsX-like permease family protein [Egibacteraceae bacterium]